MFLNKIVQDIYNDNDVKRVSGLILEMIDGKDSKSAKKISEQVIKILSESPELLKNTKEKLFDPIEKIMEYSSHELGYAEVIKTVSENKLLAKNLKLFVDRITDHQRTKKWFSKSEWAAFEIWVNLYMTLGKLPKSISDEDSKKLILLLTDTEVAIAKNNANDESRQLNPGWIHQRLQFLLIDLAKQPNKLQEFCEIILSSNRDFIPYLRGKLFSINDKVESLFKVNRLNDLIKIIKN